MKHALSTHLFVNHRLTTASLERVLHAGVELAEIFCARQHFDYTNRAQVMELSHWFKDSDLTLLSLHSPIYTDDVWGRTGPNSVISITEPVKAKRVLVVDEIRRAIEVAEYVPFKYFVQHIGVSGEPYSDRAVDAAFSSLEELSVFARQRGVEILIENIPNALSSAQRLVEFLAQTHLHLGFCFDVGHAHMGAGVEEEFDIMQDRIRSTHVHDNNGEEDKHIWPLVGEGGTIDWSRAMQVLRSREDQYPLLLELKEVPDRKRQIDEVPEIFDRLESL
jgi:sugar phosphate isomerase/epimerase